MQAQKFTASHFIKALEEKSLRPKFSIEGIVKTSDSKDAILYSMISLNEWVQIPMSLIKDIEYYEHLNLAGEKYPFVKISFQETDEENTFFNLLVHIIQNLQRSHAKKPCNCKDDQDATTQLRPSDDEACAAFCNACTWTWLPTWCNLCTRCQ